MTRNIVRISYEDHGRKGRYAARMDGVEGEGELTISRASDSLVIADHTHVPDTMRGSGVASALVGRLVENARAGGWRIVPLCPFVRAQSLRHPEWSDVIGD
ncbi:GNAT family N-acetyltransferase [uncultured Paracoccus sp.]|uniref:GNAT family N-acetyltransferase n=1 Tax=uncultured Paracoccus sp. TaxID=189685 RepID=UPI0025DF6D25|nr:GNAT family N-acetyltransferase [uncultured Paracoccus sp.]